MRLSKHYDLGEFEAIDIIDNYMMSFSMGNAFKYLIRCNLSHPKGETVRDLEKAISYLRRERINFNVPKMPPTIRPTRFLDADIFSENLYLAIYNLVDIFWLTYDSEEDFIKVLRLIDTSISLISQELSNA